MDVHRTDVVPVQVHHREPARLRACMFRVHCLYIQRMDVDTRWFMLAMSSCGTMLRSVSNLAVHSWWMLRKHPISAKCC